MKLYEGPIVRVSTVTVGLVKNSLDS